MPVCTNVGLNRHSSSGPMNLGRALFKMIFYLCIIIRFHMYDT